MGWFWSDAQNEPKSTPKFEGPGNLGIDCGPFALSFRPTPAQNWPRKPGPGTGSSIEQFKVLFAGAADLDTLRVAEVVPHLAGLGAAAPQTHGGLGGGSPSIEGSAGREPRVL